MFTLRRPPTAACRLLLTAGCALLIAGCARVQRFLPPTPTDAPTPTLTPTPTVTPSPTPSPTPTPLPPARIFEADLALYAGDWPRAIAEYQAALAQSDDDALRAAAQLGLGQARLSAGDYAGAAGEFLTFQQQFPDSPQQAEAAFLLGEAYRARGEWAGAILAYQAYQQLRPGVLDSYVQERIGRAAQAQGDHQAAAAAFQAAIAAPRAVADEALDLREALAQSMLALGDAQAALDQYEFVYQSTDQNWRKARMDILAGQVHYLAGEYDLAYAGYLDAVNNFPEAPDTFQGLLVLVNDGVPVDDLQRGLANYHAENYAPALAAFDRYVEAHPDAGAAALYYKGLTLAAQGQDAQAITVYRRIVEDYPAADYWSRAYLQIAFLQPYPDDVQTFQAFVAAVPAAPEAPDALYRAARLCERNQDFRTAVELWTRLAQEYPESAQAADAAMQAGIVLFRSGEMGSAGQRFEQAAALTGDPAQQARAWLWVGKVQARQGNAEAARVSWTRAVALDPHGYYSLRAGQLLRGQAPFSPPARYAFSFDAAGEQAQAETWLRATFPLLQNADGLSDLQPGIWQEARFVRGSALWRLGLLREAHAEFDSLRLALQGDPLSMWQLALHFNQIGAYDLSIRSARKLVDLAGYADTLFAPRFILRLRYPAPFTRLVEAASAEYGQHPFMMYAKMRLESFFWKYAYSSAAARGLNQIIPPTADDIARQLNLNDFSYDDLYRPVVSIPMGAFYLSFVGDYVDDQAAAILAGYYAGPGNARAWLDISQGDPDLLVEVMRLPDARQYVQIAFEYFETYRDLYASE